MAHDKIQFIAYLVHTGLQNGRYCGVSPDAADIHWRVRLMQEAVRRARSLPGVDPAPTTLKVFMAPEFYFRGLQGGYDLDDLNGVEAQAGVAPRHGLVSQVTNLVKSREKFEHWLFVFGTAVGYFRSPEDGKPAALGFKSRRSLNDELTTTAMWDVVNYAIVQQGGFTTEEERLARCLVVQKDIRSDIDFARAQPGYRPRLVFSNVGDGSGLAPLGQGREAKAVAYDPNAIFCRGELRFGLEVCLDHARGRLKSWVAGHGEDPASKVHVQLIPSAGMEVLADNVAVVDGGLVFNVDGSYTLTEERPGFHAQAFVSSGGSLSPIEVLATAPAHAGDWVRPLFTQERAPAPLVVVHEPVATPI